VKNKLTWILLIACIPNLSWASPLGESCASNRASRREGAPLRILRKGTEVAGLTLGIGGTLGMVIGAMGVLLSPNVGATGPAFKVIGKSAVATGAGLGLIWLSQLGKDEDSANRVAIRYPEAPCQLAAQSVSIGPVVSPVGVTRSQRSELILPPSLSVGGS